MILENLQAALILSFAGAAVSFALHKFFIGEIAEWHEAGSTQFLNGTIKNLKALHDRGVKWALIWKPLGGCPYCFTFWLTLLPFVFGAVNTGNWFLFLSPFMAAVMQSILRKAIFG